MRGIDYLLKSVGLRRLAAPVVTAAATPAPQFAVNPASAYPSVDPGIAALSIDEVLNPHQDLIDRIKICYGMDRPTFERELLAPIRRYAELVHLLPATPDNYFNGPGGLLRMGLEAAFFSLQGTDGHIFSGRSTITVRRHLEPRWRHATFIGGLCCEIHRTLCHVIVTNANGDEWQPYLLPLATWLTQHQVPRYYLKWLPNVHESRTLGVFALPHVVSGEILQHLATGNSVVVPHLMASISGMPIYRDRNILDDLVRRSVALVIDRYLQASADRYGRPQLGSHLERYLVDALRRLVGADSAWIPNGDKTRVWYGGDGLFVVWPNAAADIRALLETDQLPGIPKAPETMLEILIAAGVVEPQDDGQATWQIVPPTMKTPIEAIKLSSPAILFAGLDPAPKPLGAALVRTASVESATAMPGAPPPTAGASTGDQHEGPAQRLLFPSDAQCAALSGDAATDVTALGASPVHATAAVGPKKSATMRAVRPSGYKLVAPMRLDPAVRDTLAQIVGTLDGGAADAAACALAEGLFIPLSEFERRRIEPSLALRALAEVKMLAHFKGARGAGSQTEMRDFGGEKKLGLLVYPRFIVGLEPRKSDAPDTFDTPDTRGS